MTGNASQDSDNQGGGVLKRGEDDVLPDCLETHRTSIGTGKFAAHSGMQILELNSWSRPRKRGIGKHLSISRCVEVRG